MKSPWISTRLLGALVAVSWFAACSDSPGGPPSILAPLPDGVMVSNPVPAAALGAGTRAALGVAPGAADDLTYVSLAPGTVPAGSRAVVRRVGDAASVTTAVADGGFDPVPVVAEAGDSIEVTVTDADNATLFKVRVAVAAARPPVIVRTEPPPRKRDVPLNAALAIVFSEPVSSGTLSSSSVQLLKGTTAIAGTVRLLQGTATTAVFAPAAPLDANTDYRLHVTRAVRDLQGDPLAAPDTVDFTTGTTLVGSVAWVSLGLTADTPATVVSFGSRFQLTATARDAQGVEVVGHSVTWSSSDPSVASVSATGLVTAVAVGGAWITATVDGQSGRAPFAVTTIAVGTVTVTPESARVALGGVVKLSATVRDANGQDLDRRLVTWSSSDRTVATVAPSQSSAPVMVTGVAAGIARISATVDGKSDTATITVSQVASVVVTPESATVAAYDMVRLSATLRDAQGEVLSGGPIAWSSGDVSVATVDSTGLVKGVGAGSAAVIATSGGISDTAAIAVTFVPGGRIAFTSDRGGCREIYAMNTDGSGVVELINSNDQYCSANANGAAWSPDGTKIAFYYGPNVSSAVEDIYVMNADGSQVTEMVRPTNNFFGRADPAWSRNWSKIAAAEKVGRCDNPRTCRYIFYYRIIVMSADGTGLVVLTTPYDPRASDREPAWSPDGRIAFRRMGEIFVMNADGTGVTNLTNNPAYDASPAWSPDGTKIAFLSTRSGVSDLYVMNADGSGITALTADSATEGRPAWSPDGTKIAFASNRDSNMEIYVMNADGSGVVRLTNNPAFDGMPAWTR
jgi:Tol biopolymer transport system component